MPSVPPEQAQHFLNAPVAFALATIDQDWAADLVSAGAVAGITSVLLVMLMSQPRIFFAMSRDRAAAAGCQQGASALRHALHHHHHHLRDRRARRRPDPDSDRRRDDRASARSSPSSSSAARSFGCGSTVPTCTARSACRSDRCSRCMGIVSCAYLMLSLPMLTWVRFLVWLDIGMLIYWFYGRTHSPLSDEREKSSRTPLQNLANFVTLFGLLAGLQRRLHHRARLHDRIRRDERDNREVVGALEPRPRDRRRRRTFGLKVLVVAVGVWVVGFGLSKASARSSAGAAGGSSTGQLRPAVPSFRLRSSGDERTTTRRDSLGSTPARGGPAARGAVHEAPRTSARPRLSCSPARIRRRRSTSATRCDRR